MLSASFALPFSSHALFLFFFFFFFFRCITDVLLARRVFFHPPFGVCVCVLYITARALERVKMRLKIIQTDDEIVRLVNVYFETVWDTPVPFQIERFFRFFVFLFLSVSVRELWHSFTVEWNTTERERERERNKKINYLFFTLFCFEGNEFFSSCWIEEKCSNLKWNSWPEKTTRGSPAFVDHEKTALCDCICLFIPS